VEERVMAYNKIPSSIDELRKLNLVYFEDIRGSFIEISEKYNIKDPFAFDLEFPTKVKIVRDLEGDVKLRDINTKNVKYSWGNGTRSKGSVVKPKTSEQETVSLRIIENLLSANQPDYKSFREMMSDKKSGVIKAFPKVADSGTWIAHWEAQFEQISDIKYLKNSNYDVYKYKGFMEFITKLVTSDNDWPTKYSKKDSWNPADIWLVKKSKLSGYKKLLTRTVDVKHANRILRYAARKGHILGISLKKSDGKKIHFDTVNIELDSRPLPEVKLVYIKINSDFEPRKKKPYYIEDDNKNPLPVFLSKTSTIRFKEGNDTFDLFFRSNQSTLKNITWEIKNIKGSAFLGKVPVDQMEEWLKSINKKLPLATNQPKKYNKAHWNGILNDIKKRKTRLKLSQDFNTAEILKNIETSYNNNLGMHNGNYLQMLDFVHCLSLFKNDKSFIEFLTKCFYFAQKKGQKYDFGPFGKLY
jgi:hypothetical protein